jgi:DNA gyrase subunit A
LIAISLNEGDRLRWVRRARAEDSIIIGSRLGMAIHFRADNDQLRPLGRATRGVKSMTLKSKDELIGMDILPSSVVANLAAADEGELEEEETTIATDEMEEDTDTTSTEAGPWVLTITTGGYGKRVPVGQFRLQNRAGKGTIATKFKSHSKNDRLAGLHVVNEEDELMLVTSRGIIIRQVVKAISPQSRSATGVRVQRLDKDDAIAAVALVPPSAEEGDEIEAEE